MSIDLKDANRADVLAALYNASRPQGMGFLRSKRSSMTRDEAQKLLSEQTYFDYLHGRVMKVDLSEATLDERLYDRDNGPGAAYEAIKDVIPA